MKGDVSEKVREATRDLLAGLNLELVDVEFARQAGSSSLRVSIDRPGGVNVDDCARASELIGQVLEREKVFRDSYVLEVMSPGLDRPLKRPADFTASIGRKAKVKLFEPVEGKRRYTGTITAAREDAFSLDAGGQEVELRYDELSSARLEPELPW